LRKKERRRVVPSPTGARSVLSLIPTFATYIVKREKMHSLKNYVQAAVLRTSETVARGSTKKKDNGQKILNALNYFVHEAGIEPNSEKRRLNKKKRELIALRSNSLVEIFCISVEIVSAGSSSKVRHPPCDLAGWNITIGRHTCTKILAAYRPSYNST